MAMPSLSGSKTKYATRKSKQYEKGRVCSNVNCDVTLSLYNHRTECFNHYEFKQPRVRGRQHPNQKK